MEHSRMIGAVVASLAAVLMATRLSLAADGTAKGEASDVKGQQAIGLESGATSSNVVTGGPEPIIGKISGIQGERYSISGQRGQEITLRVTKDTNIVCAGGQGTKFSTSQEGAQEQQEIPPTHHMQQQATQGKSSGRVVMPQETQAEPGALSKDPSKLTGVVGTTDPKANEDVAKGSGFVVGGKEGCSFKVGDRVKVGPSDLGTATTLHLLAAQDSKDSHNRR